MLIRTEMEFIERLIAVCPPDVQEHLIARAKELQMHSADVFKTYCNETGYNHETDEFESSAKEESRL